MARIGATPLSELPALAAWRRAFRSFGVDPTKYRSAAEALLRRLSKQGDIPAINTLVDIGNLISIRYAMPVAVFNRAAIEGTLSVHRAAGDEPYLTLHEGEIDPPAPGEVIFTDVRRHVFARRWCWRQSDEGAARPTRPKSSSRLRRCTRKAAPRRRALWTRCVPCSKSTRAGASRRTF